MRTLTGGTSAAEAEEDVQWHLILDDVALAEHVAIRNARHVAEEILATIQGLDESEATGIPPLGFALNARAPAAAAAAATTAFTAAATRARSIMLSPSSKLSRASLSNMGSAGVHTALPLTRRSSETTRGTEDRDPPLSIVDADLDLRWESRPSEASSLDASTPHNPRPANANQPYIVCTGSLPSQRRPRFALYNERRFGDIRPMHGEEAKEDAPSRRLQQGRRR